MHFLFGVVASILKSLTYTSPTEYLPVLARIAPTNISGDVYTYRLVQKASSNTTHRLYYLTSNHGIVRGQTHLLRRDILLPVVRFTAKLFTCGILPTISTTCGQMSGAKLVPTIHYLVLPLPSLPLLNLNCQKKAWVTVILFGSGKIFRSKNQEGINSTQHI